MAKKKKDEPAETAPSPAIAAMPPLANTAELLGDGANPRKISDESAAGLRASLKRFGDLSGIVFNQQTGELVTGHQRMTQIREEYGDRDIEAIDATRGLFGIRIDEEHFFPVRVVRWSPAKQRAANVAANNQKLQGKFTGELSTYLLSVEADLTAEMPGVLDDCLMLELIAAGLDTSDATEDDGPGVSISESHQVVVQCTSEAHSKELYERFTSEGLSCKVLTL
jgi:hypothetical protein